jgi:hypothetical protein
MFLERTEVRITIEREFSQSCERKTLSPCQREPISSTPDPIRETRDLLRHNRGLIRTRGKLLRNDFMSLEKCSGDIGGSILRSSARIIDLDVTSDRPEIGLATSAPGFFGARRKNLFRRDFQPSQNRIRDLENRSGRLEGAKICSTEHSDRRKIKNENPTLVPAPSTSMNAGKGEQASF